MILALRTALLTLLLTGIAYPLVVTGLSLLVAPAKAGGSLLRDERGTIRGSALIGQPFRSPAYLQGRPSAVDQAAGVSGASNLGPTSRALRDGVASRMERLRSENPGARGPIPVDLVTTSASGLDPHLSPEAALWQVPRIARSRGVPEAAVRTLIESEIEGRSWLFLSEPRVNVLEVNLALDRELGPP